MESLSEEESVVHEMVHEVLTDDVEAKMEQEANSHTRIPPIVGLGQCPRSLSTVSRVYDTNGKGYLDSTELAMRHMDSQNLGYLTADKVYELMHKLQDEQKVHTELVEELHKQTEKAVSLKKTVFLLSAFAFLLALSNIGTSFAAAKLAQDTKMDSYGDLVNLQGQRVATTSKQVMLEITPISDSRRRLSEHDEAALMMACGNTTYDHDFNETTANVTTRYCDIQAEINISEARLLYGQFCPNYPFPEDNDTLENPVVCNGGVQEVLLNCRGRVSRILGGEFFPTEGPGSVGNYTVFPASGFPYTAQQFNTIPQKDDFTGLRSTAAMLSKDFCIQEIKVGMYCLENEKACLLFAGYADTRTCPATLGLCGEFQNPFAPYA